MQRMVVIEVFWHKLRSYHAGQLDFLKSQSRSETSLHWLVNMMLPASDGLLHVLTQLSHSLGRPLDIEHQPLGLW